MINPESLRKKTAVVVAVENIFFRKVRASRGLIIFGFGLIHGLGFASALKKFGLPPGKFWSTLLSFNFGVELGQLTIIAALFFLTRWFWKKPWYFKRVTVPVSAAVAITGLFWAIQRTFGF